MKIALITGASSGMGLEFARLCDREGLDELWLVARRTDRLNAAARGLSTPVRAFSLDLLLEQSFDELGAALSDSNAEIAFLVNAAGFGCFGEIASQPLDEQMRMIDLNVKSLVHMCNLCVPFMPRGSHVVNLGSASVFNPLPYFNIYASTKSFVRHYSRALHYELKPRGVSVSVLCPGWVQTEFFDHTHDRENVRAPRAYKPMTQAPDVVAYAMKKVKKNRPLIVHGAFTKTQHLLSKLLPHSLLCRIWLGMLEDKGDVKK